VEILDKQLSPSDQHHPRSIKTSHIQTYIHFNNLLKIGAGGFEDMRSILDHLVCLVLDTASDEFTRGVGGELSGEEDEAIGFDGLRL